jgi:hypothetical protein
MPKSARATLQQLMQTWQNATRDLRDAFPYKLLLDELLFHADLRFIDYQPDSDVAFPPRLLRWLRNEKQKQRQQTLLRLLEWLTYIDSRQVVSLYRDAFRRIITPWTGFGLSPADALAPDYDEQLRVHLGSYQFLSITQSFKYVEFRNANNLTGVSSCVMLGEILDAIPEIVERLPRGRRGLIVLEDFVGRGQQASRVLGRLRSTVSDEVPILFVPLMALTQGIDRLRKLASLRGVTIAPTIQFPAEQCVLDQSTEGEPSQLPRFRAAVRSTQDRVLRRLNPLDDPPRNAFGYEGSGAVVVTFHNTPNNTLPLIHHRAPDWEPLFRRIHHAKD